MTIDIDKETTLFRERLENGFYEFDKAKKIGEDYAKSGKLKRDIEAVKEFVTSGSFKNSAEDIKFENSGD